MFIFSYGELMLHEWPTSFKPIIEQPEHLMTAANLKKGKPTEKKQADCEKSQSHCIRDYN